MVDLKYIFMCLIFFFRNKFVIMYFNNRGVFMNELKNKKLVSGIFLILGCILLVVGFINDIFTTRKVLVDNDKVNDMVLFNDKDIVSVPRVNASVVLKNIDFFSTLYNVDVYDGKYFVDGKKLYDIEGNLLLEVDSYLDYKNGLFRTKDSIYDGSGNLLFDLSGKSSTFYENFFEIDYKFYNYNGELLFDGSNYDSVRYDEGLEYISVEKNGKWGLINKKSEIVLPIEYDILSVESDKCVTYAKENSKGKDIWYVYNLKEKKEYGPYVDVRYLKDDIIIVDKYLTDDLDSIEQWLVTELCMTYIINLNKDTEILNEMLKDYFISSVEFGTLFGDYIIAAEIYGDYGVFDSDFNTVVPFEYDRIEIYEEEGLNDKYLRLKKGHLIKYLDKDLNSVLEYKIDEDESEDADEVISFYNDLIIKSNITNMSLYNKKGNLLYQTNLLSNDDYSYLDNGLVLLENDVTNTCAYVNVNDSEIKKVNIDYSICDSYWYDDYLMKKGLYGEILFNKAGSRIFKNEYLTISNYDNYCVVSDEKGKYYIINYQEEKLIDMEFSNYNSLYDGGIVFITLDGGKYYFNYK